jgi:hypothetical protein
MPQQPRRRAFCLFAFQCRPLTGIDAPLYCVIGHRFSLFLSYSVASCLARCVPTLHDSFLMPVNQVILHGVHSSGFIRTKFWPYDFSF